jgi:hypothetical protein
MSSQALRRFVELSRFVKQEKVQRRSKVGLRPFQKHPERRKHIKIASGLLNRFDKYSPTGEVFQPGWILRRMTANSTKNHLTASEPRSYDSFPDDFILMSAEHFSNMKDLTKLSLLAQKYSNHEGIKKIISKSTNIEWEKLQ